MEELKDITFKDIFKEFLMRCLSRKFLAVFAFVFLSMGYAYLVYVKGHDIPIDILILQGGVLGLWEIVEGVKDIKSAVSPKD